MRWFEHAGYLGLVPCEGASDGLVHSGAIQGDGVEGLREGHRMGCERAQGEKGGRAASVTQAG
jgi:cold shock CspA family protein